VRKANRDLLITSGAANDSTDAVFGNNLNLLISRRTEGRAQSAGRTCSALAHTPGRVRWRSLTTALRRI